MMFDRDLDDAEDWVTSWATSMAERAERTRQLAVRIADLSATATGADGLIEVRVDSSGALTDLYLNEGISGWPARRIEREIMATVRVAQAHLTEQVAMAVADTVGTDSETGRAVVSGFT